MLESRGLMGENGFHGEKVTRDSNDTSSLQDARKPRFHATAGSDRRIREGR